MEAATQTNYNSETNFDAGRWIDDYGNYLFAFAMSRVRNEWVAEDLVQETFMAGIRNHKQFEHKSSEKTWLCGILKHKIVDYFRKSCREKLLEADEESASLDVNFRRDGEWKDHWTAETRPAVWKNTPEKELENSEFRQVLHECLSKMPEATASVFVFREVEGMDTSDICELLGISANSCWVSLHRARMQLRRCLEIRWFRKANKNGT